MLWYQRRVCAGMHMWMNKDEICKYDQICLICTCWIIDTSHMNDMQVKYQEDLGLKSINTVTRQFLASDAYNPTKYQIGQICYVLWHILEPRASVALGVFFLLH